jgi:hypothetical protein
LRGKKRCKRRLDETLPVRRKAGRFGKLTSFATAAVSRASAGQTFARPARFKMPQFRHFLISAFALVHILTPPQP